MFLVTPNQPLVATASDMAGKMIATMFLEVIDIDSAVFL
jgi:hypothetical protein